MWGKIRTPHQQSLKKREKKAPNMRFFFKSPQNYSCEPNIPVESSWELPKKSAKSQSMVTTTRVRRLRGREGGKRGEVVPMSSRQSAIPALVKEVRGGDLLLHPPTVAGSVLLQHVPGSALMCRSASLPRMRGRRGQCCAPLDASV